MTKRKIIIIVIALFLIAYLILSYQNNDFSPSALFKKNSNATHSVNEYSSPIFSVNFVHSNTMNNGKYVVDNIAHSFRGSESQNISKLVLNNTIVSKPDFTVSFDDASSSSGFSESSNDEEHNDGKLLINDIYYMNKNSTSNIGDTSQKSNNEIIFVSDSIANQLVSCRKTNDSYECHPAVSYLDNPQDILVINNYIYIVNSHQQVGESGDIVKCNINNSGYISNCGQTQIDLHNPIFFHYNPPYLYISEFVYSGGSVSQAIKCTINYANGRLSDCNQDYTLSSLSYISKYYLSWYYRPKSNNGFGYIEKCHQIDSTDCMRMTNHLLSLPLSLSIHNDNIFISNAKSGKEVPNLLKCSLDLRDCNVITDKIKSPMCIGVYDFQPPF